MASAQPALEVIDPGPLSTLQDLGRPAAARHAVPTGGAMDLFALEAANRLVGNAPGAAAVEVTAGGATFSVRRATLLAVAGGDLSPALNGWDLPMWTAVVARAGARLTLGGRRAGGGWGGRAYLAVSGGVEAPVVLDSRSAYLPGRLGGLDGRALQAGDVLAAPAGLPDLWQAGRRWPAGLRPAYSACPVLRLIAGPHQAWFEPASYGGLTEGAYRVGGQSNRMGFRLEGPPIAVASGAGLPSLGVVPGALQVPPDGAPILLMADAQTTGGYPVAGVVIRADLPLAAQLLPGDALRFRFASVGEAVAAWREQRGWLERGAADEDDDRVALGWAGAL